jgi:hypothetical protein
MSGKIMGQVWDLDLPTNEQLVLLAMTDHADHLGENIWPSVGLIAWKTGYSERTIQRLIKSLLKKDILKIQKRRPGKTTIYCTAFENAPLRPPYKSEQTPDIDVTPDTKDVTPTPDTQMSPEPSLEPSTKIKDSIASGDAVQSNAEKPTDVKGQPFGELDSPIATPVNDLDSDFIRKVFYENLPGFTKFAYEANGGYWVYSDKVPDKHVFTSGKYSFRLMPIENMDGELITARRKKNEWELLYNAYMVSNPQTWNYSAADRLASMSGHSFSGDPIAARAYVDDLLERGVIAWGDALDDVVAAVKPTDETPKAQYKKPLAPGNISEAKHWQDRWYDAVKATTKEAGFRNGRIVNVLRSTGKDGYAKYNLVEPLTHPDQLLVFWEWYQGRCPGCDLRSVETVQSWVMEWQGKGMPDVRRKSSRNGAPEGSVFALMGNPYE